MQARYLRCQRFWLKQSEKLPDLPGIHAVQQGGPGKSASMFIRGGDPGGTLVLIDGMRANDPSNPSGLFDFGHLGVDGFETIEVAKGPYAAQYGGDAMAGVVSIRTAKGKGKPTFKAAAEAGSFETFQQSFGTQGQINAVDFNWNPEPYERNAFSSRLGAELNPDWHLSLWNRYQHNHSRYVNDTLSNPSAQDIGIQWFNRAQLEGEIEHTYLRAKDLNSGLQLLRRPLHKFAAKLNFQITERWDMGMGAIYNGKQADISRFTPYGRVYMGGVTVLRVHTTYRVSKNCEIFGRIENALDRHFEEPAGYAQPGLAVYTGVRIRT
eukprot:gene13245-13353_t